MKRCSELFFSFLLYILHTSYFILNLYAGAGDTGAQFLTIPVSARAIALGDAYVAVGSDVHAIEYNPAGLSFLTKNQLTATHILYFRDVKYTSLALASRNLEGFGFGFRYRTLYTNDVQRDSVGTDIGEVSVRDQGGTVAISYEILNGLSFGASGEIIERRLFDITAKGFAVGFGAQVVLPWGNNSLGISVQNVGKSMKFVKEDEAMPVVIRAGGSHGILSPNEENEASPLLFNWELQQFRDQSQLSGSFGIEGTLYSLFLLRAGGQLFQSKFQPSGGVGFRIKRIQLDYAIRFKEDVGLLHSMTLLLRFGKDTE